MFTGIIEEKGTVKFLNMSGNSGSIAIRAHEVLADTKVGDSISVNGVCLTVISVQSDGFTADVMHETTERSALNELRTGDAVNLERAMAAGGRFGGHIVSGHIDGIGRVSSLTKDENAVWVKIKAEPRILRYIVEKGSIAIDGISLTVAKVTDVDFSVSIIPHTGEETTLLEKKPGDTVNLETDIVGKYVEKLMRPYKTVIDEKNGGHIQFEGKGLNGGVSRSETASGSDSSESGLTLEFLVENGF